MLTFFVGILFLLCAAGALYVRKRFDRGSDAYGFWNGVGHFLPVVAALIFVASILSSFIARSIHYWEQEELVRYGQVATIYQQKADELTNEFAQYLATNYPEHERDIFENIQPSMVGMYFVRYPELQAADTMRELVDRIDQLVSDVYDQQVAASEVERNMRFRERNPWLYQFLVPNLVAAEQ